MNSKQRINPNGENTKGIDLAGQKYLTTVEAAKALDISVSTIQRYYDGGKIAGKKHPITRKRLIAEASLKKFAADFGLKI